MAFLAVFAPDIWAAMDEEVRGIIALTDDLDGAKA